MSALDRIRSHAEIVRLRRSLEARRTVEIDEAGVRRAAVALMLRLGENDEPEIFFIQRAQYDTDPWSGQVAFPGGRAEPGDRTLMDTAIRETLEETQIDLRRDGEVFAQLDDLHPRTVVLPPIIVRPFVALLGGNAEPELSDEVAASFWVPLAALRGEASWRDTVVTSGGVELTRRAFHHTGFVVWGMTERILTGFLDLVP